MNSAGPTGHPRCVLSLAALLAAASCGPPVMNTPIDKIPSLASLAEVMDNQATTIDPEFSKIGKLPYGEADHAAFARAAERLEVTSLKIKDFSRGAGFDAVAMELHEAARSLGAAAKAKDDAGASAALTQIKSSCKSCHTQFR